MSLPDMDESIAPDVTVVICTRNRAEQLRSVLASAEGLVIPDGLRWELLIVDNGSSDHTRDVVLGHAQRLPVRYTREDKAGLSNARNHGVAEARGTYICWTDDDVRMDREWLAAYFAAFRAHPEAAVFGGRVNPVLESPTPDWFRARANRWPLATLLARRDLGDQEMQLSLEGGKVPWGANFALRTAEQRRHLYDPQLGVSPLHKRVGEETDVIYRIMRDGGTGWWVPGSKVDHIIPPQRQTMRYVHDYYYLAGETTAYVHHSLPAENFMLAGGNRPACYGAGRRKLWPRMALHGLKYGVATLAGNIDARLANLRMFAFYRGMAAYRGDA